jgi:hypothetical protein
MLNLTRYLAIIAIAGFAINSDPASSATAGLMQKEVIAAAMIALLSLPNIIRWAD